MLEKAPRVSLFHKQETQGKPKQGQGKRGGESISHRKKHEGPFVIQDGGGGIEEKSEEVKSFPKEN